MVTSGRARVCLLCAAVVFSSFSHAAVTDRIQGPLAGGAKVALRGNMHGHVKAENDLGRADGSRPMQGITLAFRPSEAQRKDLDDFLTELGDRSSPNYHKYLTPKQFGQRFGMSWNDLNKITAWLEAQGFTNIKVANGRNEVSFDGTVSLVESTFGIEMHHYLVDGEVHLANAGDPLLPPALAGAVVNVAGLHNFAPRPRAAVRPNLTSFVTGNHFLSPADFATIYDLNALYSAGFDGTGQKIAIVGQSTVNTSDLNHFRSAAGLAASTLTMTLQGGTGTRCGGDEGESNLDLEWAGGVAKGANIIFVYAGLSTGDTCTSRGNNVWNALDYAVQHNVAPFISTSYGFCEAGLGTTFAHQVQGWAQQGQTQGQTIVAASGDSGAADCDTGATATQGLAVDVPSAVPEVTGAGGTVFFGDASGTVTGTAPNTTAGATQYWSASGTGSDVVSTALSYIPEHAWNDTTSSGLSASGGGASTIFAKPSWQTGTGVPNDSKRDVPDISLSSSPNHDGYLFCTEDDGNGGIAATCTSGFRTGAGGNFTAVGGTSAAAPTFAAILALVNQYLGNTPPTGLAPINPALYSLAASSTNVFNDVTQGDNIVPCTQGTPGCPAAAPFQYGFSAGTGYDQVTGLGSVNGFNLAQAMNTAPSFSLAAVPPSHQLTRGSSVDASVQPTPFNGFTGLITYACTDTIQESTCTGPSTPVDSSQSASFHITTTAPVARLERPLERGTRIFYAALLPGLLGIVFVVGSRKGGVRSARMIGLVFTLGASTLWLGSCGGSSHSNKDPGTPAGTYTVTVKGTATINNASVSRQAIITITVVP